MTVLFPLLLVIGKNLVMEPLMLYKQLRSLWAATSHFQCLMIVPRFAFFIFRTGTNARGKSFCTSIWAERKKEVSERTSSYAFPSEWTGYLTIELFRYIMKKFENWWTSTRPGLHCFLICNIVTLFKRQDVVVSIYFINIMPGSSHWFQVHYQQPFGQLKEKNDEES